MAQDRLEIAEEVDVYRGVASQLLVQREVGGAETDVTISQLLHRVVGGIVRIAPRAQVGNVVRDHVGRVVIQSRGLDKIGGNSLAGSQRERAELIGLEWLGPEPTR